MVGDVLGAGLPGGVAGAFGQNADPAADVGVRPPGIPATEKLPEDGRSTVVSIRMAVVLPAPFGPSTPRMRPAPSAKLSPSTATTGPYATSALCLDGRHGPRYRVCDEPT